MDLARPRMRQLMDQASETVNLAIIVFRPSGIARSFRPSPGLEGFRRLHQVLVRSREAAPSINNGDRAIGSTLP